MSLETLLADFDLFDDWEQSIPINIETICDELELVGTIVAINMEPLTLEYEGYDDFIYNLDFKFTTTTHWRVTRVNTITPHYFVLDE